LAALGNPSIVEVFDARMGLPFDEEKVVDHDLYGRVIGLNHDLGLVAIAVKEQNELHLVTSSEGMSSPGFM